MEKTDFSKRLRAAIDQQSIRQSELCEKTGIRKSAMSQYLSGAFKPKQQNLYRLAKALDVSEAWLMGYDVPMQRNTVPSRDAGSFYFRAEDDSMAGAHIPYGANVLIERNHEPKNNQIVACIIDSSVILRRFIRSRGHIVLLPESNSFEPVFLTEQDLNENRITILGIATQIIIDLRQ